MSDTPSTGLVLSATEQERLDTLRLTIAPIVQAAQSIEVRNENEVNRAVEFLSSVAREKKAAENTRVAVVGPLTAHVKFLNEQLKGAVVPLQEADAIVRPKVVAYQEELDRKRLEAEERLRVEEQRMQEEADAEKRLEEEAARAEREEAARQAAIAEAEAQAAARARETAASSALEQEMSGLSSIQLASVIEQAIDRARVRVAEAVMGRRREHRAAEGRAVAAREAFEDAARAEQETRDRPADQAPRMEVAEPAPMRGLTGAASTTTRWKGTVEDVSRLPRKYMVPDQKAIDAAVKAGARNPDIPGVNIEQIKGLQVRAK